MTYFLDLDAVRDHNTRLLAHLPRGPMFDAISEQAPEDPIRTFEALVAYYAAQEDGREDIRSFFYALDSGESWCQAEDGPTSGQLAEASGLVNIPPLPDDLVEICRTRLMPQVQEHSKTQDVDPIEFLKALEDMGINGSITTEDDETRGTT
jgi:hypothetical protein